jgi:hypothetical protein
MGNPQHATGTLLPHAQNRCWLLVWLTSAATPVTLHFAASFADQAFWFRALCPHPSHVRLPKMQCLALDVGPVTDLTGRYTYTVPQVQSIVENQRSTQRKLDPLFVSDFKTQVCLNCPEAIVRGATSIIQGLQETKCRFWGLHIQCTRGKALKQVSKNQQE